MGNLAKYSIDNWPEIIDKLWISVDNHYAFMSENSKRLMEWIMELNKLSWEEEFQSIMSEFKKLQENNNWIEIYSDFIEKSFNFISNYPNFNKINDLENNLSLVFKNFKDKFLSNLKTETEEEKKNPIIISQILQVLEKIFYNSPMNQILNPDILKIFEDNIFWLKNQISRLNSWNSSFENTNSRMKKSIIISRVSLESDNEELNNISDKFFITTLIQVSDNLYFWNYDEKLLDKVFTKLNNADFINRLDLESLWRITDFIELVKKNKIERWFSPLIKDKVKNKGQEILKSEWREITNQTVDELTEIIDFKENNKEIEWKEPIKWKEYSEKIKKLRVDIELNIKYFWETDNILLSKELLYKLESIRISENRKKASEIKEKQIKKFKRNN